MAMNLRVHTEEHELYYALTHRELHPYMWVSRGLSPLLSRPVGSQGHSSEG